MIRKFILLCLVGLLTVVPSSSLALTAADAFVGYKVCCEKSPSGIYPKDEFVYFVSEFEIAKRVKRLVYEGKSMLNFKQQLTSHIVHDMTQISNSAIPYGGVLGARIREAITSHEHININIKGIQAHILVNSSMRNEAGKKVYRYVVAVPVPEIKKQKKIVFENLNQVDEVVRKVFSKANQEDKFQELIAWYLELGMLEDALYYQRELLTRQIHLVNYYRSNDPFSEREILRKILLGTTSNALSTHYLSELPANAEIIQRVIEDGQYSSLELIVLLRTMHLDLSSKVSDDNHKKIAQQLSDLADKYAAIHEYVQLERKIRNLESSGKSSLQKHSLLKGVLETSGHLVISERLSDEVTDEFKEAQVLFHKGRDPEKIKQLLIQSLQLSPRHLKSWEYLAAILSAQKMDLEALLIYTQLYQMDNSNLEIMANLADSYSRSGLKSIAKSYISHVETLGSGKKISKSVQRMMDRVNAQLSN